MKRLTLLRHAKSSWNHGDLSDFERPLNGRGRRAAPLMGRYLAERWGRQDCIVSSPATRAITTARAICQELQQDETEILILPPIYLAPPEVLLSVLQALDDEDQTALLVGHNPGISELSRLLCPEAPESDVPTCAAITLALPIGRWPQISAGSAQLLDYQTPKRLKRSTPTA